MVQEGKPWVWRGRRGEGGFIWGSHRRESCLPVSWSCAPCCPQYVHSVTPAWPLWLPSVLSWATGLSLAQLREIMRGSETKEPASTSLEPSCLTSSSVAIPTRTGMTHPVSSATNSNLHKTIPKASAVTFSHMVIL